MSLSKVNFGDKEVKTYTVDFNGENWMAANPFADALNYNNTNKPIRTHVSEKNQRNFEDFRSAHCRLSDCVTSLPRNIQAKTKFINRAGVFELINASDMPGAKRFKQWNSNDLLPTLCQEGEYSMVNNAPVHVATNDGIEAPWLRDLEHLKTAIVEKDRKIDDLTMALCATNEKLQETNNKLVVFAGALVDANKGLMDANKQIENLANRMADIAQDVITKPSDPQLLHSLAVCAMGGDQYAFLRPQKRSLKRSLHRLSVDEKDIVYKSDYVPNSMNVLNKVKERLPKEKYKARHNRITLHEDLTREDLLSAFILSLNFMQHPITRRPR